MTTSITAVGTVSSNLISDSRTESATPAGLDVTTEMINSGDIGTAIAALRMLSQKEMRATSRSARDAAYEAQEAAQRDQIEAMEDASDTRLMTGIAEGSLKLGSAGLSVASVSYGVKAETTAAEIRLLGPADKGTTAANQLLRDNQAFKSANDSLNGSAKGLDAYAAVGGSLGRFFSEGHDREATKAGQRADSLKRIAENHADDVRDVEHSTDRTIEFLNDWRNAKDAAVSAALYRA